MLLGAHESTAGGLSEAFARGEADGAEAIQIFVKSSRMWAAKPLDPAEVERFHLEAKRTGLGATASVHASYLINLGSDEGDLRNKSIAAFADEVQRCNALGVRYLVVHPGSHADAARGVRNVAAALDEVFARVPGPCHVLLETAAGQGSALGRTFEELRDMRDQVRALERVAVCLDTCHVFAAGYDIASSKGYDDLFANFERILGLPLLKAFHLNDSKKPLGCRVDRHEHPGQGCIGGDAFRRLINDARFTNVPAYLELPPEGNRASLQRLRRMRTETPSSAAAGKRRSARVAPARRGR